MQNRIWTGCLGLVLTAGPSLTIAGSEGVTMVTREAKWTTNLRTQGYTFDELTAPGGLVPNQQIAFGGDDELVVTNDRGSMLKPNRVHAFILETKSGNCVGGDDWGTRGFSSIFGTTGAGYVVKADVGIARYSSGLRKVVATSPHSARMISPDRRTLASWVRRSGHGVTSIVDAETLRPLGVEFLDENVTSICGDQVAYINYANRSRNASVMIRDGKTKFPPYETECDEVQPHFLSKGALAIFGCGRVEVIRIGEGRQFVVKTDGEGIFAAASQDGGRFAFSEVFRGKSDEAKLLSERVSVVDVLQGKAIFVTEIKELRGWKSGESGVALSPNGSLLAVNSAGIVRLFSLETEK